MKAFGGQLPDPKTRDAGARTSPRARRLTFAAIGLCATATVVMAAGVTAVATSGNGIVWNGANGPGTSSIKGACVPGVDSQKPIACPAGVEAYGFGNLYGPGGPLRGMNPPVAPASDNCPLPPPAGDTDALCQGVTVAIDGVVVSSALITNKYYGIAQAGLASSGAVPSFTNQAAIAASVAELLFLNTGIANGLEATPAQALALAQQQYSDYLNTPANSQPALEGQTPSQAFFSATALQVYQDDITMGNEKQAICGADTAGGCRQDLANWLGTQVPLHVITIIGFPMTPSQIEPAYLAMP